MYSDGSLDETSSLSEATFSDDDSVKSEDSTRFCGENTGKKYSGSEDQTEMDDEDILWNPRDIEITNIPDEKPNIKDMIKKYITDPKNADCVVTVRGKEFRCHKLLLQCYSSYFKKYHGNCVELNFPSLTPEMFGELYAWMFGSQCSYKRILQPRTILDVLIASMDLGIRDLEEQCWAIFNSKHMFDEETAYSMFLEAKLKSCDIVADIMLPRVSRFFAQLAASDDFLKLPVGYAADILDSAHVSVPSEAHVFTAALRWLAHDWDARLGHATRIMGCVRFQYMSPMELVIIRRTHRKNQLQKIMEIPEVQDMLEEGLQYAVLLIASSTPALQNNQFVYLLEQLRFKKPKPRHYSSPKSDHNSISELLDDFIDFDVPDSKTSSQDTHYLPSHSISKNNSNTGPICHR